MLRARQMDRECPSLGFGRCGLGNDSLSSADGQLARGFVNAGRSMKRTLSVIGVIALILVAAALYLRVPGSAPPNQEALVTLTPASITHVAAAVDARRDRARVDVELSAT